MADELKERQARVLAELKAAGQKQPALAIVVTAKNNRAIDFFVSRKQAWADEIGAGFLVCRPSQAEAAGTIEELNQDPDVSGIVIQLPLAEPDQTDDLCRLVDPAKDVDGLNPTSSFTGATVIAIGWLLNEHNIELQNKQLVVIGQGRLVGQPLAEIWRQAGLEVTAMDDSNLSWEAVAQADVVVSATGRPKLLQAQHLRPETIVIDAGTCSQAGRLVGDVDPSIYETRQDLTITPPQGGLGPITVAALFENLIVAAQKAK